MEIVKVLHTGDLHLGKITGGLTERQKEREREYLRTFHNIITMCLEQNVEIMLVAGDLFDCDDPQDELINDVIHEFLRIQDTVIMIAPGNHDYYRPGTYYDKISTKCENVLIFDGKMDFYEMKIHGKEVRIYGAGFTKPVVSERLMQQREIIEDTMITLAVFHGDLISGNQQSYYGPLKTEWIRQNCFDYLALGHIHKQTDVINTGHSNYAYCGCPEGFGFGEQGVRGVYVGEVGHGYQNMQYVRTCKRMYLTYTLNLDRLKDSTLTSRQVAEFICNDLESIYGIEYIENYYRIEITGQGNIDVDEIKRNLSQIYYTEIIDQTKKITNTFNRETPVIHEIRLSSHEDKKHFIINGIHIGNFGGLKNVQMNFEHGFQTIYGPNEFGKTTIMAFIRMMLYGCSSKSRDLSVNLRKKYQPFDKSQMHGTLVFTLDEKTYIVEKEFGKSSAFDIRNVIEKNSGKEIIIPKEKEIGDYFLGIQEDEFEKTMFAAQPDGFLISTGQQSVISKIANLSKGLPEMDQRPEQIITLTKQMESLQSKRGTSGKIPEITEKIEQYKKDLNRYESEKRNLEEQKHTDLSAIKKEYKILKGLIDKLDQLESGELNEDIPTKYKHENKLLKKDKRAKVLAIVFYFIIAVAATVCGILYHPYFYIGTGVSIIMMFLYKLKLNSLNRIYPYEPKAQAGLREKTEIIMEELGYGNAGIEELEERLEELEDIMEDGDSDVLIRTKEQIKQCKYQIQRLSEERFELNNQYEALGRQIKEIEQSVETSGNGVVTGLNERALELFNQMTENHFDEFMIAPDYSIRIRRQGNAYYEDCVTLSTATAEQAYLALRISLCEKLADGGIAMPLILDDILGSYDKRRVSLTKDVLKCLGTQVILFTCHE